LALYYGGFAVDNTVGCVGKRRRVMATMAIAETVDSIPEANYDQVYAALDYTSRYYLSMSAQDFITRYDTGQIRDTGEIPGVRRVLEMLELIRSKGATS
jgi:hypothetical protein